MWSSIRPADTRPDVDDDADADANADYVADAACDDDVFFAALAPERRNH